MASPSCPLDDSEERTQPDGQIKQDHPSSVTSLSTFVSLLDKAPNPSSPFLSRPTDDLLTNSMAVTAPSDSVVACPLISALVASSTNNNVQPTIDGKEEGEDVSNTTGASLSPSLPNSGGDLLRPKDEANDVEGTRVERSFPASPIGPPHPLSFPNATSSTSYPSSFPAVSTQPGEITSSPSPHDQQSNGRRSTNTGILGAGAHVGVPYTTPLLAALTSCNAVSSSSFSPATTTLASSFGIPLNHFVGSLPSPFLAHNVFLPHPLPSPLLDNVINLTNSWRLLNACTRWNSEVPSSGLPLPTPTFPEINPQTTATACNDSPEEDDSSCISVGNIKLEEFPNSPSLPPKSVRSKAEQQGGRGNGLAEGAKSKGPTPSERNTPADCHDPCEGARCCVRWHEQTTRLCAYMSTLQRTADSADLSLSGGGGVAPVPAHRVIMAAASPVIRDALQGIRADQAAVVVVPRATAAALEALVSLCYTGTTTLPQRHLADVLKIASELEIAHLRIESPTENPSFATTSSSNINVTTNNSRTTSSTVTTSNNSNVPNMNTTYPCTSSNSQQPVDYRITSHRSASPVSFKQPPPSPPSVFTFPPRVPRHSPPSYSSALASSILARTGGGGRVAKGEKRRPLTPDISHTQVKKVKTEATFLPGEVQQSFPFSPSPSGSSNMNLPPGCVPSQAFSSALLSAPPQSALPTLRDGALLHTIRSSSLSGGSGTGARVLLWKFLLQLLHDTRFCPVYIRWLDRSNGVFRIMESDMVAQLWGIARKNSNMNYEKMSRGMRTYYKRGILYHIDGTKLIYKFNTSEIEVQQHMHYFEQAQQALEQDHFNDSSSLITCAGSATLLTGTGGAPTSITDSKLDQVRRTATNVESELPATSAGCCSDVGVSAATNSKDERQGPQEQLKSSSPSSSSSLPFGASHLSSQSMPCFTTPSLAGPSAASHGSSLLSQTLTAVNTTSSSSSSNSSASSGTSHVRNTNKSLSRLELFGLNKPRSNSIPNFQTSARFTSFFSGSNSNNSNNKNNSKGTTNETNSISNNNSKSSSVTAEGEKSASSGNSTNKFRSTFNNRNKQYPHPLQLHTALQEHLPHDQPTAKQKQQQEQHPGQHAPRLQQQLQQEPQQSEKLSFVFATSLNSSNRPY